MIWRDSPLTTDIIAQIHSSCNNPTSRVELNDNRGSSVRDCSRALLVTIAPYHFPGKSVVLEEELNLRIFRIAALCRRGFEDKPGLEES